MEVTIRTKSGVGTTPLYTRIKVDGQSVWTNLLMKVEVEKWNKASVTPQKKQNFLDKLGYSKKLNDIEYAIKELRKRHRLTKETLDKAVKDVVLVERREEFKKQIELKEFVEQRSSKNVKNYVIKHIENISNGTLRTVSGMKYAKNSIKNWKQFKRVFIEFYDERPFTWDEISKTTVDRFLSFLENKGYKKSVWVKSIEYFKTIVRKAEEEHIHSNTSAKKVFRRPVLREQDKIKEIYLSKEELEALYEMELDGFEEQVRDVFLIGCYTAQRFSDYSKINSSCIGTTASGTKVIRLVQKKTKSPVVVPILDDKLEVLLKKYDYNVPNIIDVSLNRAIKRICENLSEKVPSLAKKEKTLLTKVEKEAEAKARKEGKELFEYDEFGNVVKPRWILVSSHTARRSAITNMYLSKKYSTPQMMSVSGHKSVEMFNQYIKLSLDEIADGVASSTADGMF